MMSVGLIILARLLIEGVFMIEGTPIERALLQQNALSANQSIDGGVSTTKKNEPSTTTSTSGGESEVWLYATVGAIGGVVLIATVLIVSICCSRRRRRKRQSKQVPEYKAGKSIVSVRSTKSESMASAKEPSPIAEPKILPSTSIRSKSQSPDEKKSMMEKKSDKAPDDAVAAEIIGSSGIAHQPSQYFKTTTSSKKKVYFRLKPDPATEEPYVKGNSPSARK